MANIKGDEQALYLQHLAVMFSNNKKVKELFNEVPVMSKDVYTKTTTLYANIIYEEAILHGDGIPHGFCQVLEDSIEQIGLERTLEKFNDKINLVCQVMKIDIEDLIALFKKISNYNSMYTVDKKEAILELRNIFKKFNVKFKGEFSKRIIEEKNRLLNETIIKVPQNNDYLLPSKKDFLQMTFSNAEIKKRVISIIYELFSKKLDDNDFNDIILAVLDKNCLQKMIDIVELDEPKKYVPLKQRKNSKRLKLNFEKILNDMAKLLSDEEKLILLNNINDKCNSLCDDPAKLKVLLEHENLNLIEQISVLLKNSNSVLKLENGSFTFADKVTLTDEELEEGLQYESNIEELKKIEVNIKSFYHSQRTVYLSFMQKTDEQLKANDADIIDVNRWLNINKMDNLIPLIIFDKIDLMNDEVFNALKKFLINDGFLWAYLAGNIDKDFVANVINSFSNIYDNFRELINIDSLFELKRKLSLFHYSSDLSIGLIGLENLEKIINYNQFSGVNVTDELIFQRIRKVVDLAVKSENITSSSLPFNCFIQNGDYNLQRYQNNDPSIFTSGIDTKTCFFISANENDFFFYSLLSKDGYVIKILNNGKFIARATCFRKNNILMINGIRFLNNKTVPENKEQVQLFKDIVRLIKLMAKKMIELTTNDACPIDYVVCNKAGILENNVFEDEFEILNADLFKEPINIYSDDWEKFVHTYDNESEQMLQEVSVTPNHSFTTDFGDYYPACLIESRNNMGLLSPRDISYSDQDATYDRPRLAPLEYINEEIDKNILFRINRLRALECFRGTKEEQSIKQANYHLINDSDSIRNVILGEDWCIIVHTDGFKEIAISKNDDEVRPALKEISDALKNKKNSDDILSLKLTSR